MTGWLSTPVGGATLGLALGAGLCLVLLRVPALRRPTLDDVFLSLTGHAAEEMPIDTENGSPVPAGRTS